MPQHERGDHLRPVRQVHLGARSRPRAGSHVRTHGSAGQPRNHHAGTGEVMALNYITLVLDLAEGTGTPLATGQVEDAEYEPVMLFINHSCEPNVGFADNTVLVAMRDISPRRGADHRLRPVR
jgi:hypothetical protein